jgi:hypothetical protein
MPLSPADRGRCRRHLGYPAVSPAPSIQMGIPRMQETAWLVEMAFDVLMEDQVLWVIGVLNTMDKIEAQQVDALSRLRAEKLDTLTLRGDEEEALERQYCNWGWKLAGVLGCMPYPFAAVYQRNGAGGKGRAGSIPVRG